MIIWSVQSLEIAEKLQRNKTVYSNKSKLNYKDLLLEEYAWMASQMEKRIGNRPNSKSLPFWGFYQYNGKIKKPDLRTIWKSDKERVLLKLDIPDDEVCLSDYNIWENVLNKSYICKTVKEWDKFYEKYYFHSFNELPKYKQNQIVKSWEQIFNLNYRCIFSTRKEYRNIQATFWSIKPSYLKNIIYIKSRKLK